LFQTNLADFQKQLTAQASEHEEFYTFRNPIDPLHYIDYFFGNKSANEQCGQISIQK